MTELNKQVKITEDAHTKLSRAKLALFGDATVRYSDTIEELADRALDGGDGE